MNDSDCIQKYNPLDKSVFRENSRTSHVTVSISEIKDHRTVAIFFVLGMIVVVCLVAVLIVCVFHMCGKAAGGTRYDDSEPLVPQEEETVPEEQQDSPGLLSENQEGTSGGQQKSKKTWVRTKARTKILSMETRGERELCRTK
jgi:hypothetical protein